MQIFGILGVEYNACSLIFQRKPYILRFELKYLDETTFSATIMTFYFKEILCILKKPYFQEKILLYGTSLFWNKEKGYFIAKKGQIRFVRFYNFPEIVMLYYLDTILDIIFWPFCDFLSNTKFGLDFEVSNFYQKLLPGKIR